ncbi:alpha-1A adrenergic receptor-like [Patiria miniata]|uniref:G-protein coupled receptors family 1 profile domain-containing protein n=1 Tax=Patiria miniata TaxID=46514 RepID=A0A914BTC4_PATMI|nr:alpha-1A adrenergic receptor-like [Patiria miniata]
MHQNTFYFDASKNEICLENCGGMNGAFDIIKCTVVGIIALLIIIGNIFCLLVLWRTKEIHLISRLFMAALTATDLTFGFLVVLPVAVSSAYNIWPVIHDTMCHFHEAITSVLGGALTMSLLGISIDRLIAVCKPLQYPTIMTQRRALILIITLWALPFIYRIISKWSIGLYQLQFRSDSDMCWVCTKQTGHTVYTAGVGLFMVIPCFCTFCIYARLFVIARRHARRIAVLPNNVPQNMDGEVFNMHTKSAVTFLLITATFGICWMPFTGVWLYREITGEATSEYLVVAAQLTTFSSSWLDCLVYYYRSKVFKRTARKMICKMCCCLRSSRRNTTRLPTVRTINVREAHELDCSTTSDWK